MKLRIIIADDDPIMRLLTRSLLEAEDKVEVVGEAINGLEALKLAKFVKPDIICMDMNMPIMSGLEATRHIADMNPEIAVIPLSGDSDALFITEILDARVHHSASKSAITAPP